MYLYVTKQIAEVNKIATINLNIGFISNLNIQKVINVTIGR